MLHYTVYTVTLPEIHVSDITFLCSYKTAILTDRRVESFFISDSRVSVFHPRLPVKNNNSAIILLLRVQLSPHRLRCWYLFVTAVTNESMTYLPCT